MELEVSLTSKSKLEDEKSTVATFFLVSIVGLVFLLLFYLQILPIPVTDYTRQSTTICMGLVFLVFFIIGLHSLKRVKEWRTLYEKEATLLPEVSQFLMTNCKKEQLDQELATDTANEADLYFLRRNLLEEKLLLSFTDLSTVFIEDVLEAFYTQMIENNH